MTRACVRQRYRRAESISHSHAQCPTLADATELYASRVPCAIPQKDALLVTRKACGLGLSAVQSRASGRFSTKIVRPTLWASSYRSDQARGFPQSAWGWTGPRTSTRDRSATTADPRSDFASRRDSASGRSCGLDRAHALPARQGRAHVAGLRRRRSRAASASRAGSTDEKGNGLATSR